MRYLENHDQDRAKEIIPKESALRNWTAFLYFQKGATLLYAGQENQNETRPDLFNKDVINLDGSRDISDMLRLYQIKSFRLLRRAVTVYRLMKVWARPSASIRRYRERAGFWEYSALKGNADR